MSDMVDYLFESEFTPNLEDGEQPLYEYGGMKSCRRCGESGLSWMSVDGKWRLGADGIEHRCKWEAKDE